MDWTDIITALIAALIPTGGLTAIVTMRDKKTAAFLENVKAITEQWQQMANEYQERIDNLKAELVRKDEIIDKKDGKIESLYREKDDLRQQLDHERTGKAVAELMKCEKTECTDRRPPFGQGQQVQCRLIEKGKDNGNKSQRN